MTFRPWTTCESNTIENPKYIINKNPIGDGSYSVVFECKNKSNNQRYAAKKYSKRMIYGLEEMLTNEFKILSQLSEKHPHILSLIDYFETEDSLYLVTDLAEGGDLYYKIINGRFDESRTREITIQLTNAIQCLHSNDLIHRDIKAENIFFQTKSCNTILLGDFGLARLLHDGKLYDVSGTLSYMAPEMFDRRGYDFPVDIWAIGVCVYFMLGGYMPFDCETDEETKDAIKTKKYLFEPSEYWDQISKEAKEFISACFELDPLQRPNIDELAQFSFLNMTKSRISTSQRNQILHIFQDSDDRNSGAFCKSPDCLSALTTRDNSTTVSREPSYIESKTENKLIMRDPSTRSIAKFVL